MDVAAEAARDVGDLLRSAFARTGTVETKRDFHDLVTAEDRMVEDRLAAFLLERVSDSSIHGEEGGRRGSGRVRWYIDPIDGTNNFASQIPFFCVSIAAEYEGRLVAGVIYDPIRSELFSASEGEASCNGSPIVARGAATESEAMLVTDFPAPATSPADGDEKADLELFGRMVERFGSVRRLGSSALALAYVAAGRADVTMGTTANPWDVAAGLLLVRAAGGTYHALPPSQLHASRPWLAATYVAHVADFDYAGSSLAPSRVPGRST